MEVVAFFFHNTNTKNKPRQQIRETPSCEMKIPLQADKNSITGGQEVIYLL